MYTTYSEKVASCNANKKVAFCNNCEGSTPRNTYVKVASCTPGGELHLSPSALAELVLEQKYSLEHLSTTYHGASQAIAFAVFCRETGQERTAISSLKDIWHGIHISRHITPAQLAPLKEQILHEVSLLWFSPDEYVWEEASQWPQYKKGCHSRAPIWIPLTGTHLLPESKDKHRCGSVAAGEGEGAAVKAHDLSG